MTNRKINVDDAKKIFPEVEAVSNQDVTAIVENTEIELLMKKYNLSLVVKDGVEGFSVTNKTPSASDIAKLKKYKPEIVSVLKDKKQKEVEKKEAALHAKLYGPVKYNLNNMNSYGMYNGISEFDIEPIVNEIKKQLNCEAPIWSTDVAKIINKDVKLKEMAFDTYEAYPVNPSWLEEYKTAHIEGTKNKTSEGFGTIPNQVIREKITEILIVAMQKDDQENSENESKRAAIFEKAKDTGEKQQLNKFTVPCNDPKEECDVDIITVYATPDGKVETVRNHTW